MKTFSLKSIIFLIYLIFITFQYNGFDISVYNDEIDCFQCVKEAGYDLMIIEIYSSGKVFSKNIVYNIKMAQLSNINVHVYIFPDIDRDPVEQVHSFLGYLKQNNANYNAVWLDVENTDLFFKSCDKNVDFLQQMLDTASQYIDKSRVGIYASNAQWEPIMCGSQQFKDQQLWWPRWNNKKSFDDFASFGGWSKPTMKQIIDEQPICCIADTDLDWAPEPFDTNTQNIEK